MTVDKAADEAVAEENEFDIAVGAASLKATITASNVVSGSKRMIATSEE